MNSLYRKFVSMDAKGSFIKLIFSLSIPVSLLNLCTIVPRFSARKHFEAGD